MDSFVVKQPAASFVAKESAAKLSSIAKHLDAGAVRPGAEHVEEHRARVKRIRELQLARGAVLMPVPPPNVLPPSPELEENQLGHDSSSYSCNEERCAEASAGKAEETAPYK